MKRRSLQLGAVFVFALLPTYGCRGDRTDLTRFPEADRVAIRAALDSFPDLYQGPTAVEDVSSQGDTLLVTLIAARGAADPGKWDGPRLDVWVLRPARILRSKQRMVE
jgi:hypothetical protein